MTKKLIPITKETYKEATLALWKKLSEKDITSISEWEDDFKENILTALGYDACCGCPLCYIHSYCTLCDIRDCFKIGYDAWKMHFFIYKVSNAKLAKKFYNNIKPLLEEKKEQ